MIQINAITFFFYIIIFALIILIVYFNIIAGSRYDEGMIIQVSAPTQCKYPTLPLLTSTNQCKDGTYYFQSPGGNYYILGTQPVFYHTVCKSLCGGGTDINGQCGEKNPAGFNICLADLKPQAGCKNSAVPLAIDDEKTIYYAQEVNISVPCKI